MAEKRSSNSNREQEKQNFFTMLFSSFGSGQGGIGQIFATFIALFTGKGGNLFGGLFGDNSNAPSQNADNNSNHSLIARGREAISNGWDRVRSVFVSDMPKNETYVSARRSGNDTIFTTHDGDQVVKVRESTKTASRSWANNNPGNIEFGSFSKRFGAIGTDGRFAIFPTVEAGFEAQKGLLKGQNYRDLSLRQAIYRWAPPSENNSDLYARTVAQRAGIDQNTLIRNMSDEQLDRMVRVMAHHEGWKAGKVAVVNNSGNVQYAEATRTGQTLSTTPRISSQLNQSATPVAAAAPAPYIPTINADTTAPAPQRQQVALMSPSFAFS